MSSKKMEGPLQRFGTHVALALRPKKQSVRRLGLVIIGLWALFVITPASVIQKLHVGSTNETSETQTMFSAQTTSPAPVTTVSSAPNMTEEQAATISAPNIVDLVVESEYILRGLVKEVTDGIENGVPFTQVTVQVSEAFRGEVGEEYTFRQFGLTQPRKMENGRIYLGVTPDGWSRYEHGEDVVLFLYKQASITGLRTTAGLGQGKLAVSGGNITSQFGNAGLFEDVAVDNNLLNDRDKRLLATKKGPVNTESFISFVRRAVKGNWIEGGKMRHAKK